MSANNRRATASERRETSKQRIGRAAVDLGTAGGRAGNIGEMHNREFGA